jgi:hypothetical protein
MTHDTNTVFCVGCGAEILWSPVIVMSQSGEKHSYCCEACRDYLECDCGVRMEIREEGRRSEQ